MVRVNLTGGLVTWDSDEAQIRVDLASSALY